VCVGFGISTPAQAAAIGRVADGVIVGSALVDVIERAGQEAEEHLVTFLQAVRTAVAPGRP
jgi:tryptophan synthase alpha chain